jgi:hypothetical protein
MKTDTQQTKQELKELKNIMDEPPPAIPKGKWKSAVSKYKRLRFKQKVYMCYIMILLSLMGFSAVLRWNSLFFSRELLSVSEGACYVFGAVFGIFIAMYEIARMSTKKMDINKD